LFVNEVSHVYALTISNLLKHVKRNLAGEL